MLVEMPLHEPSPGSPPANNATLIFCIQSAGPGLSNRGDNYNVACELRVHAICMYLGMYAVLAQWYLCTVYYWLGAPTTINC